MGTSWNGMNNVKEASIRQAMPGIASKCQQLEEVRKEGACWCPDFRLLASRTVSQYISVILSPLVCISLLWQPQETNTGNCVGIGLAKKFIQIFPLQVTEKSEQTFWPVQ